MATFTGSAGYAVTATGTTVTGTAGYTVVIPAATYNGTAPYVVVAAGSQVFTGSTGYTVTAAPEPVKVYRIRPVRGQVPVRLGVVTGTGLVWLSAVV